MIEMLELLADEAPLDQFESVVSKARQAGVQGAELEQLENVLQLALRIYSRLQRGQQREAGMSALVDIARELAAPYDLDELLRGITRRTRLLLGTDMAYIALRDEEKGVFRIRTSDGHISRLNVGLELPDSAGLGIDAMSSSSPSWSPDYLNDDRIQHSNNIDEVVKAEKQRAVMAVPLIEGNRPLGALYVASRSVRHFTPDETALMSSLAELVGVAISRASLLDRVASETSELERHSSEIEAQMRELQGLRETHIGLVEQMLGGIDLQEFAEEAGRTVNGPLRILGPDGSVLVTVGEMPEIPESLITTATMDAHANREPREVADGLWAAPLFAGREALGTLLLQPSDVMGGYDLRMLRLVIRTVALQLLLQNSRDSVVEDQARDELLEDLLANPGMPSPRIERRARRFGIELDQPHIVIIIRPEEDTRGKEVVWAASYAARMGGLKSMHDGRAVLLLPGEDASAAARAAFEKLTPLLKESPTVSAAGPVTDPAAVHQTYMEAKRCLDAMTALGVAGRPASARELGYLGLLLSDNHDVEGFIASAVGPVIDYDRQRLTELTRTLEVYFSAGNSPTYAAKKLHVHPNTVARRIERISELLGPEWQQADRALEIQLALRLFRMRHTLREREAPSAADAVRDHEG